MNSRLLCKRAPITEKARLIIGADGVHSLVARTVQAPTYHTQPPLACWYYTYWSGVPTDGAEVYPRDGRFIACQPTHDGLVCITLGWTHQEFRAFRADIAGNYRKTLDLAPGLAARVDEGKREERFVGTAGVPNFFRKPYGPGWALVGDAGYHKDPVTAQGMTDAFRDAEWLVEAIDAGFSGPRPSRHAATLYRLAGKSVRDKPTFWYDSRDGPDPGVFLTGEPRADHGGSQERWIMCSHRNGIESDWGF